MSLHPEYSQKLLDHYRSPRNVGEIEGADAIVTVGNPGHGDVLKLSLRIDGGKVAEARFKSFGCAVAIAAGSVTTEIVQGMRLEDLTGVTNSQVAEALGGVPEGKMECSVLAERAIREAVAMVRGRPEEGAGP
ncbi:MAG TPA: iron-sulfur cluster assembly scaffold protein [Candidatus Polarisedimenticolia bacterium]|nr:iron-sulfur cluster assembly scaffold protein [Candidatus Polarisedimenticolia bacterium]